jgi:hypothetical protein
LKAEEEMKRRVEEQARELEKQRLLEAEVRFSVIKNMQLLGS